MPPSGCIGRTVAGMRPSRFSAISASPKSAFVRDGNRFLSYDSGARTCQAVVHGRPRTFDNRPTLGGRRLGQLDIFSLEGRVALIPGGGGGIGAPIAEAFAAAGAK